MMVEERNWLTPEQFNETYALCSMLGEGGNIINFSVIFGLRRGVPGALVASVGLLGPPMVLVTIIGAIYAHYGDLPALRVCSPVLPSAAAGLMMATVAKTRSPVRQSPLARAPLVAIATFVSIGIIHWPLPLVLAVLVPVSIASAWMRL